MNTDELQWPRSVPGKMMSSDEVHVWRVFLDSPELEIESFLRILSVEELGRASRFHFEKDKKRFIVARGILRNILSHYLGICPQNILFEYTAQGKPSLASGGGEANLRFNLSHSNEVALYAISRCRNIGIDIERVQDDIAIDEISKKFYSHNEIGVLANINKNDRSRLFFQYWTRKEAILKGTGKGISFPMEQCDVSTISGRVLSPVILPGNNEESVCWYVQDLFPGHGYVAAIGADSDDCKILCWHYSL